jgi:hypothetical protein
MRLRRFGAFLGLTLLSLHAQTALAQKDADSLAVAARLEQGVGGPRDYERALTIYCSTAREGSAEGAFGAARMYLNGVGMQRDIVNGIAWLRMAAGSGSSEAARLLNLVGSGNLSSTPHCRATFVAVAKSEFSKGRNARIAAPEQVAKLATQAASEFELDPNLVLAVIATESGFQSNAVSPKNAKGLMQLTDGTARRFGVKDPFEPKDNVRGGVRYLRWLLQYFNGDVVLALAGYNAGEEAVVRHGGVPPYAETREYIEKIKRRYPAGLSPRKCASGPATAPRVTTLAKANHAASRSGSATKPAAC